MFLLSKLLPLLLLPLGLALLLLLWAALRGGRAPLWAALALLWLFATPLMAEGLWRLLEWPHQRFPAAQLLTGPGCGRPVGRPLIAAACTVVVLGGGRHAAPGADRISEWQDADRFFGGLEAYRQLQARGLPVRLLFTGGWWPTQPQLPPEGETLRRWALALGVPPADLLSTVRVRNTAEEARAVAALLPRGSSVVLVTSAFHMARAQRLFERSGLRVLPFPVDFQARGAWAGSLLADPLQLIPSADGLARSSSALRELMGRTLSRAW